MELFIDFWMWLIWGLSLSCKTYYLCEIWLADLTLLSLKILVCNGDGIYLMELMWLLKEIIIIYEVLSKDAND